MITVTFFESDGAVNAFTVSGHSEYSEEGSDIVCSAVSSAVLMAANTITEIQLIKAEVTESDGYIALKLSQSDAEKARDIISGLKLHLTALSEQYSKYIKVKISEV